MGRPGSQLTGFMLSWMSTMALDVGLSLMSTLMPDDLQIYCISYGQVSGTVSWDGGLTVSGDGELVFCIFSFVVLQVYHNQRYIRWVCCDVEWERFMHILYVCA